MPSILDTIAAQRRIDVSAARQRVPEGALQEAVSADQSGALDLYARILREGAAVALAAEFKRCSSKGDIAVGVDAGSQPRALRPRRRLCGLRPDRAEVVRGA